ncbi:hypothetical protein DAI22_06g106850 [Oryza sativa Japonica Group]|nr:hypothetical protein DAI22_06g106850 [Oryza sativa Japonica Group]
MDTTPSTSSTFSPTHPARNGAGLTSPRAPLHLPTSPADSAAPRPSPRPLSYKINPRGLLFLFPRFPESPTPSTELSTPIPIAAARRRSPAARRRCSRRRRASPRVPSASPSRAARRPPLGFLQPPSEPPPHRVTSLRRLPPNSGRLSSPR